MIFKVLFLCTIACSVFAMEEKCVEDGKAPKIDKNADAVRKIIFEGIPDKALLMEKVKGLS